MTQFTRHMTWALLALFIASLPAASVLAAPAAKKAASDGGFFSPDNPQGWFWYDLPEPRVKKKRHIKKRPVIKKPPKKRHVFKRPQPQPRRGSGAAKGPRPYSVVWIRKNLPKYRRLAIDNPTRQNVLAYLYLQRLAMDKAQRFAMKVEAVVKTTPFLDESSRRPVSSAAGDIFNKMAAIRRDKVLRKLTNNVGIWYFFGKNCMMCSLQGSVLKHVSEKYNLHFTAIAMDGAKPVYRYESFRIDRGQAKKLGIIYTPIALVLVNPSKGEIVPLSHSFLTIGQLKERIFLAAHTAGWLTDVQYNKTLAASHDNLLKGNLLLPDNPRPRNPPDGGVPISTYDVVQNMREVVKSKEPGGW